MLNQRQLTIEAAFDCTITLSQQSTFKGVGDDAAVLDFKGKKVLVSTDTLPKGIHFVKAQRA